MDSGCHERTRGRPEERERRRGPGAKRRADRARRGGAYVRAEGESAPPRRDADRREAGRSPPGKGTSRPYSFYLWPGSGAEPMDPRCGGGQRVAPRRGGGTPPGRGAGLPRAAKRHEAPRGWAGDAEGLARRACPGAAPPTPCPCRRCVLVPVSFASLERRCVFENFSIFVFVSRFSVFVLDFDFRSKQRRCGSMMFSGILAHFVRRRCRFTPLHIVDYLRQCGVR